MVSSKTLKISYVGDASGVSKTLGTIDKAHATFADKLKSTGAAISATGSSMTRSLTLPIVAFGAVAVNEFSEAQQVLGQTDTVLKSTGGSANVTAGHVATLATNLGTLAAQDNETVQSMENVLLTFTNIKNVGPDKIFDGATKAVLNLSSAMGTDMQSAAVQVGKALNDPVKGITALTRVGVTFSDQQKKQIENMVKVGDTAGAQKLILGELTKEFGGSAKAAGENASPFTKLSLAFKDIAQIAGQFLVPMLTTLAGWLSKLGAAFQSLSPQTQKIIVTVLAVVAAIGPLLIVVGKLVSVIGMVSKAFTFLAANPAVLIWIIIAAAVIALVIVIVKNWGTIKAFLLKVWNALKVAWAAVWNAIKAVAFAVWNAIKTPVMIYIGFYKAALKVIWTVAKTAFNIVKTIAVTIWHAIKAAWNGAAGFFSGIWDGLKSAASAAWDFIKTYVLNPLITGFNIAIKGFNLIPGHDDVPMIPTFASGGIVTRPTLAMIGEAGPEAVVPLGRRGLGGGLGGSVVVNVHVAGSVTSERDLAAVVHTELLKVKRRNGAALGLS